MEARELQKVLEYKEWRNFKKVIDKGIISCVNSNAYLCEYQFIIFNKPLRGGNVNIQLVDDFKLSRYACTDEIHQLYVVGRTGKFIDVLIDTIGASLGCGVFYIVYKMIDKKYDKVILEENIN